MRTHSKVGLLAVVTALLVAGVGVAPAAAAPIVTAPGRLYTLVDVPILFDGSDDLISGDTRELIVAAEDAACAPEPNDPPAEGWSVTGCPGITLSVGHGILSIPIDTGINDDVLDPEGQHSGGALLMTSTNGDGTGAQLHLNGTSDQLTAALADLVYTPDAGYEYTGSNPETLTLQMADSDGPAQQYIDIRVRSVNEFPTITAPGVVTSVPGGVGGEQLSLDPWTVEDADVDDPVSSDLGLGNEMLFVSFSTCGAYSLRGGAFTAQGELEAILSNYFETELDISDSTERDALLAAILAGMPSEVAGLTLGTNDPTDELTAFAAIGERDEIEYALSQVTYRSGGLQDASCQLYAIVSDLGHNGMPAQYIGSPSGSNNPDPESPVPGFEIPAFGVDWDISAFDIEAAPEIELPALLEITEGNADDLEVTISDATHPALSVGLIVTDVETDAADYTALTTPVEFPEDAAGPILIPVATIEDLDIEIDETFTVAIDPSTLPDGIAIGNGTAVVRILNDDVPPDVTPPTVTVEEGASQDDPTSTAPVVFDVVFSEPVVGLTDADFLFTGSTVGGTLVAAVAGGPTVYTVSVTGMTTAGDVQLSLPASAATDGAGNPSGASTSEDNVVEWEVDDVAPTVTVNQGSTQVDPTSVSPVVFDVEFSEPVTGLTGADFSFTASTVGGTLVAALAGGPTIYTVSVTGMTTAGDVVLSLPAAAATDAAGNDSEASSSEDNTVGWETDGVAPTVTVDQGATQVDPTNVSPIVFDVVFSEPVTGLVGGDFAFTASTVGGTLVATVAGGPTVYTASVTGMTTAGDVVLTLPAGAALDAELGESEASTSEDNTVGWETDDTAPTVTVDQGASQADPTSTPPIVFDVVFSEPVTGLVPADFSFASSTVGGSLAVALGGGPTVYTASVTGMTTAGDVVLSLGSGVAEDASGNPSEASTSTDNTVTWEVDDTPPTVTVDQGASQADPTSTSPIVFDVVFSEPVTGLVPADFSFASSTVGGSLAVALAGGPTVYTASISGMTTDGDVVLSLGAGVAEDSAGNPSAASSSEDNTVTWQVADVSPPSVTVEQGASQLDPTNTAPVVFDVTFLEDVTGLTGADFDTSASTVGGTLAVAVAGGPRVYTASVTGMTTDGDIELALPAAAATDLGGNPSLASTSADNVVEWDVTAPTVVVDKALTQADPTMGPSIRFSVVFSEPVTNFDGSHLDLSASTVGSIDWALAGSGAVYEVTVTGMDLTGVVVVELTAGAAIDAAGNETLAATYVDNEVAWVAFVAPQPPAAPTPGTIAATGSTPDAGGTIGMSVLLLGLGILLVLRRRRAV